MEAHAVLQIAQRSCPTRTHTRDTRRYTFTRKKKPQHRRKPSSIPRELFHSNAAVAHAFLRAPTSYVIASTRRATALHCVVVSDTFVPPNSAIRWLPSPRRPDCKNRPSGSSGAAAERAIFSYSRTANEHGSFCGAELFHNSASSDCTATESHTRRLAT